MFTGIVADVGILLDVERKGAGACIRVETSGDFLEREHVQLGDSIACNGVCLTVTSLDAKVFSADVSYETMEHTCFKEYTRGTLLNLEAAVTPATHMGGHIVQGHVDATGVVSSMAKTSDAVDICINCPHDLMRYIAYKGSITVDGISLTVNDVAEDSFRLTLIPHTRGKTNFATWRPGHRVNLEADVLARYLERLMTARENEKKESGVLTLETLIENGF